MATTLDLLRCIADDQRQREADRQTDRQEHTIRVQHDA